ncbi:MAG: thioredoxin [Planctomycetes bacterium]|nr:thioredoxin [Planctomycetota bacterium]
MSERVIEVTDADFDSQVMQSELPVVLDLWAPWCGPCRMISPLLKELAEEHAGQVKLCKINVDENPQTAVRFGIQAIPTILFFADGEEKNRLIGVRPKSAYQAVIEEMIS